MKKLLVISLMLIGMVSVAQENIGTMAINLKDSTVHCYFLTKLDTTIKSDNQYVGRYIKSNLLQPQLSAIIKEIIAKYPTCVGFNYQNGSFFDGKEHVWITLLDKIEISIYISDIDSKIQESTYYLGVKTIQVIQGGNYEN